MNTRKSASKDEIVSAARGLFSQKGYHGTTIREIAEARGILSGSLYAHIESKEDLLFLIVDEGADAFLAALQPIVQSSASPAEKLRAGLAAHIAVVATQLDSAKVFLHDWTALSQERRAKIQIKRDTYEQFWTEILQEGDRDGVLQLTDAKFARLLILSAANWVYQWYDPGSSLTPQEIAERFTDILLHGMLVDTR